MTQREIVLAIVAVVLGLLLIRASIIAWARGRTILKWRIKGD